MMMIMMMYVMYVYDDICDDDVIHNVSQTRSILQFIHLELRWRTGRDLR